MTTACASPCADEPLRSGAESEDRATQRRGWAPCAASLRRSPLRVDCPALLATGGHYARLARLQYTDQDGRQAAE